MTFPEGPEWDLVTKETRELGGTWARAQTLLLFFAKIIKPSKSLKVTTEEPFSTHTLNFPFQAPTRRLEVPRWRRVRSVGPSEEWFKHIYFCFHPRCL